MGWVMGGVRLGRAWFGIQGDPRWERHSDEAAGLAQQAYVYSQSVMKSFS